MAENEHAALGIRFFFFLDENPAERWLNSERPKIIDRYSDASHTLREDSRFAQADAVPRERRHAVEYIILVAKVEKGSGRERPALRMWSCPVDADDPVRIGIRKRA